jgi:hypothetical protein
MSYWSKREKMRERARVNATGTDLMRSQHLCPLHQKLCSEDFDALDKPRSARHFLSDARSESIPFTEVYFMDLQLNSEGNYQAAPGVHEAQHTTDGARAAARSANLRLYFMLRERSTHNLFDMGDDPSGDAPRAGFDGRIEVVFDVCSSPKVAPLKDARGHVRSKTRRSPEPDIFDSAAHIYEELRELYGTFYAPLNTPVLLQLDTRFPHSPSALLFMTVEFRSLLSANERGKTAIQHAVVLEGFSTLRHLRNHIPCVSLATLPYFAYYHKRLAQVHHAESQWC